MTENRHDASPWDLERIEIRRATAEIYIAAIEQNPEEDRSGLDRELELLSCMRAFDALIRARDGSGT